MSKILVVDDQFGVRLLLGELLQYDNHEVKMAVNGFEALQLLSSFEPALILLDMKMPGMNGIETLEKIRAVDRQVNVIMMTGNDDPHNTEQAKGLGILCYITKPFDLFKLKEQVREILNTQISRVV